MSGILNGAGVRDAIIKQGQTATEATAFYWGNLTKSIQDTGKAGVMVDSGKRGASGIFKATKDFSRGDPVCGTLCSVSVGCEATAAVLVWVPIPGKIVAIAALKTTSVGCQKFRDLCAQDPSSPLC